MISSSRIDLAWTAASGSESIRGYRVDIALGNAAFHPLVEVGNTTFTYSATDLVPNALYEFRITALYATVDGPASNIATLRTNQITVSRPPVLGTIPCLDYQAIPGEDEFGVPPDTFEEDLLWFNQNGYTSLTLSQLEALATSSAFPSNLPARPILLFSGTSSAQFHQYALPRLQTYGHVATLGLVSGVLDDPDSLCASQLAEISGYGIELASISASYPDGLTELTDSELAAEIFGSRSALQGRGLNITSFLYPHGVFDARVIGAVATAGYSNARGLGTQWTTSIARGGYASFDPRRRLDVQCAPRAGATTRAEFLEYVQNPRIEVEDLYVVEADPGSGSPIERTDFDHTSHAAIYTEDAGDRVTFKVVVNEGGVYDIKFHVKTGIVGDELSSAGAYGYKIDGRDLSYSESGPTEEEQEFIVWGYHTIPNVTVPAGVVTFTVEALRDWAVIVDWMEMTRH